MANIGTIVRLKDWQGKKITPTHDDFIVAKNEDSKKRAFLTTAGTIEMIKDRPGNILFHAEGPNQVIISETFFPGWKATLNGEKKTITLVQDIFPSVEIPKGRHTIHFYYCPISFVIGAVLTCFTILLAFWSRFGWAWGRSLTKG